MQSLELNTKKKGKVTIFTFKQGRKYVAVCLELDIVKEGSNPSELNRSITEAVIGHVEAVCKGRLNDDLLNRPAPAEYWKKYWAFVEGLNKKSGRATRTGAQAGTINVLPIAELCAV